jgi:uncharacterized protein (UPF0248 family)
MFLSRLVVVRTAAFLPCSPRRSIFVSTRVVGVAARIASSDEQEQQPMANLYKEWTLEEDGLLWKNLDESVDQLAARLGRGLRGVEARISKLKNVDSQAYQRLFVERTAEKANDNENEDHPSTKQKLVPVGEVLRRIQWDYQLDGNDFSILHYDRMDDEIVESPFNAPNVGIAGKARQLIDALPEHRIVGVKFKERMVWDREERLDLFFTPPGIEDIMQGYDDWSRRREEEKELSRQRQVEVSLRLQQILGPELFSRLKELSSSLGAASEDKAAEVAHISAEDYVKRVKELFRNVRNDPDLSANPELIPLSDYDALDLLSELVALMPDKYTRATVLLEISNAMRITNKGKTTVIPDQRPRELPQISDDELTETFVRGSGPGGQKVNKTSNRVVLVHNPTQVRVEVQDTRSLQQNRKIARKRLRQKLDDFLNGTQSKSGLAAVKASSKKAKAKARSKARQRKKEETKKTEDIS